MSLDDLAAAAQTSHRVGRPAPGYQDIVTGASVLRVLASIWIFLGVVALLIGAVMVPVGFARREEDLAGLGGFLLLIGLNNVIFALLVRMFASIGLAIRDIARNSFR